MAIRPIQRVEGTSVACHGARARRELIVALALGLAACGADDAARSPVDASFRDARVEDSGLDHQAVPVDGDAQGGRDGGGPDASAMPVLEGPTAGGFFVHGLEQALVPSVTELEYVFEEYFLSGMAAGESYKVRLRTARPAADSGTAFSGHVIVEPKHPVGVPFIWYFTREYLARHGHAAVEITTFPSTVESTLQGADPERYADLHVVEAQTSDIFAQIGRLLRSEETPLPGTEFLYMTGHSMSAGPTWRFMDTHHATYRLEDGAPIYDGFFPETTRTASRLGPFPDVDVPTVLINSELEVQVVLVDENIDYRKPDSDEPGRQFRLYEVAGLAHNPAWQNPISIAVGVGEACDEPPNAFPYNPTISMALDHLIRWVADDIPPPRAERIALVGDPDDPTDIERDEHGNAVGGVRSTTLDVPVASYSPLNTPEDSCLVFGSQQLFVQDKLLSLYDDHAAYVEQVDTRLDELIEEGWFLEEFAEVVRTEAADFDGFE